MSKMADNYYEQSKKWLSGLRESLAKTNSNIDSSYDSLAKGIQEKYQNNINQFQNDKQVQQANALSSGRQAYRQYMNSINPFSATQGQLARAGLGNSGYAESMGIRANNNYLSNVGNINTQRDLALANLDSQIANAINTRDTELQETEADRNKALYDNYMNWLGRYEDYKKEQEAQEKAKASAKSSGGSRGSSRSGSYLTNSLADTEPITTTKKATPKKTTKKATKTTKKTSKSSFKGVGSFGNPIRKYFSIISKSGKKGNKYRTYSYGTNKKRGTSGGF